MKTPVMIAVLATVAAYQVAAYGGGCGAACNVKADESCPEGVCAPMPAAVVEMGKAEVKEPAKATIGIEALATLIRAGTPLVLLDARAGKWDDGRRIPGARSLNAESSEKDIATMLPDKSALIVTYCTNLKCQASPKLAKHLTELGYKNVVELPEGIDGWEAAGQKVEKK